MNQKIKNILKVMLVLVIVSIVILVPVISNAASSTFSSMLESAAQRYNDVKNYKGFLGEIGSFTNGLDTNKSVDEITDDKEIVKDLGADSLDVVEMLMTMEEEFGITVPEDQVANVKTVKDIADLIANN